MSARRLLAAVLLGAALPAWAQVAGEGAVSAGALQTGGPDVSHQQPLSSEGVWLSGWLSAFSPSNPFAMQWQGVGTPDFRLRLTLFQPGWLVEASAVQRAYLAGGDARFAWDPWTGILDTRVPQALQHYAPLRGSPVGTFDPATLPAARGLLPDGSPGWVLRDYALTFRTLGQDRGFECSILSNEREGTLPRTFVTATGFTPTVTPLTASLPVGSPLGVVEVPDRISERTIGLDLRGFLVAGAWRWEGEALAERYEMRRLITDWANPFPGPDLKEPAYFRGTQALLRVSGQSAHASVSVERSEQWGHGEAGERKTGLTRLRAEFRGAVGHASWFVRGFAAHRNDEASLEPAGPHPVFQGPYYDLLGPRIAPVLLRAYPYTDDWIEAGAKTKLWELSARLRHFNSPSSYARDRNSALVTLALTPVSGLRVEVRPSITRATDLNPQADKLSGGWMQATDFLPANAREWKGLDATVRYLRGPLVLRALYRLGDSGDAPGLQRRESGDLFAGYNATHGPWRVRASGRLERSNLSGRFTNYALPGDPVDPEDPTHRLPMGETWRREGESAQVEVRRAFLDLGTFGLRGIWDHESLTTHRVLDQPRHYQYALVGVFWARSQGSLGLRAEVGLESYRLQDPLFAPAQPPPGPYLWAGLTERPGTRGYARLNVTWKF